MTSVLRRLLFVEAPQGEPLALAGTDESFVVTALLRRRRSGPVQQFRERLADIVSSDVAARRDAWGIRRIRLFGGRAWARPIVFFLEFTRTEAVAAWLCRLKGQPRPPHYRLRLSPLYDAVLELRFDEAPTSETLAAIRTVFAQRRADLIETATWLASPRQVQVYDSRPPADGSRRVSICFLVRRPPPMTRHACQDYWRTQHAQLALRNMRYLRLTAYRQVHTAETPPAGCDDTFDGVVYAEKPSWSQLFRDLMKIDTARFNNTVVVDESHFTYDTPVLLIDVVREW